MANRPVPVRILAYVGPKAAVESEPLTAGMEVIVDGAQRLRPDQPVQEWTALAAETEPH
jgi:multidrug efflux pump subunit AcrA (membrane-fusion protein)